MTAPTRRPIIAGNWKMYKTTPEAKAFIEGLATMLHNVAGDMPEVVVCPPFTALAAVQETVKATEAPVTVAAQTMESRKEGAYTGEVSPNMLLDLGVKWVVLGHSERRQYFGETDQTVGEKTVAALASGMTPIVCVGELLAQRESGETDNVVRSQVEIALANVSPDDYAKIVIAYEPVWAIGTGKVCEADEANRVCGLIRETLSAKGSGEQTRVLYGGSMKPENSRELLSKPHIDGGLIGGASLEPASFFAIVESACLVQA